MNFREASAPFLPPPLIHKNQVIIIGGATSVGKSAVARELCLAVGNAELVVADSVQVYRHLNIGSNKPSAAEQAEIPHHMINLVEPSDVQSTGDFCRRAAAVIKDVLARGKLPGETNDNFVPPSLANKPLFDASC